MRMAGKAWGNEFRQTTVCVDSYQDSVFTGRLYNPYLSAGKEFHSMVQFLSVMDETLDAMNFPQSFTAKRTFATPPKWEPAPVDWSELTGELATFTIRILFRQNASWQGSVSWLEGGQEQSFRSALELIFLMDSALKMGESQKKKRA